MRSCKDSASRAEAAHRFRAGPAQPDRANKKAARMTCRLFLPAAFATARSRRSGRLALQRCSVVLQTQQAVTALVDRLQPVAVVLFDVEQHAQPRNVAVDGARERLQLAAPDHRVNMIARQHAPDVREEQRSEPILRARQLHALAAHRDRLTAHVEAIGAGVERHVVEAIGKRAPQQRVHARAKHRRTHRQAHVVVGAHGKSAQHAVVRRVFGREQHRNLIAVDRTHRFQQLRAREPRALPVEHQHVDRGGGERLGQRDAVAERHAGMPALAEHPLDLRALNGVALENRDTHEDTSLCQTTWRQFCGELQRPPIRSVRIAQQCAAFLRRLHQT
ncbi:hypothetical protein PT2222_230140 [Paraburkholderia tropica]